MWAFFKKSAKAVARFVWRLGPRLVSLVFVVGLLFFLMFAVLDTRRDIAYRNSSPGSPKCATWLLSDTATDGSKDNSTVLTKYNNDELSAIASDPGLDDAFTCMLQRHAMREGFIPYSKVKAGNPSIGYYLSFLEFQETGNPAEPIQFQALSDHLKRQKDAGRQNFVFAFVHGWRHDARIGDENVENVRLMSAHLASFLEQRCKLLGRYCGVSVTAVYIGWRGARVDEQRLDWLFGGYFPGLTSTIGNILASMTLFDRKPVSERIAPSVVSALQEIDRQMRVGESDAQDWFERSRMIVVGHSLGGNLLATALQDQMIAIVNRNFDAIQRAAAAPNTIQPKPLLKSPLGDLVVLLNPASEAEKWTSIQRAFSNRVNEAVTSRDVQTAYRVDQPPIYLSLTAAHSWPANDIHNSDVDDLAKEYADQTHPNQKQSPCQLIIKHLYDEYEPSYEYDSATYDLFPFFKFDFRPLAQTIEDQSNLNRFDCTPKGTPKPNWAEQPSWIAKKVWIGLAAALRNLPFMNTNIEQTRTIGHVDPMRAPYGRLVSANNPATWIGTTHEFLINAMGKKQRPPKMRWVRIKAETEKTPDAETASYEDAASPENSECDTVDGWLSAARKDGNGSWDSGWSNRRGNRIVPGGQPNLTHIRYLPDDATRYIEGQFRQNLYASGMRPITGPNDPFWNVRGFESAMTNHNGYVSYPLICSIFQFVMDKINDETAAASLSKPGP